ncbi:MAG TPA: hypothetical protein VFD91_11205 [Mariniphaga sp.]|nr:hypothetical protein [Mariniphaga sp.]
MVKKVCYHKVMRNGGLKAILEENNTDFKMKKIFTAIIIVALAIILIILGLSFIVPIEKSSDKTSSNSIKLRLPNNLSVADFCYLDGSFYFIFNNSSEIYKLIGDSITSQWGEYGIGNLKFRSLRRIKNYNQRLFVSDLENLQVQSIDTTGKFLGSYPKRNPSDFLFLSENEKDVSLRDFFVNDNYFVICFGEYYKQKVSIYHKGSKEVITLPVDFSLISAIDFDSRNNTLFIADASAKTIYAYNPKGKLLNSIGIKGKKEYMFSRIEDIDAYNDKLYVLDVYVDGAANKKGYGLIHVFDSNLSPQGVLGKKDALFIPKAIEFTNNDKEIAVINRNGNELKFVRNTVE